MSRMPYGVITPDQRDQTADDCDEAARQRDLVSAARDRQAGERDVRAEDRMQAAVQYSKLARRVLDAASPRDGQKPGADQQVMHELLRHLDEALQDAERDRQAATRDRRAAAEDRDQAAEDRFIKAAHRGQAAIERAQQTAEPALPDHKRWTELSARAYAACALAEALCQTAQESQLASAPRKDALRRSELARLRARLDTMPVIEQAKGIIMMQSGCGDAKAFDVLRQASQRLNEPVRDLAVQIVTGARDKRT